MEFFKMHNLGNDYIYIFKSSLKSGNLTADKIRKMCNRNLGVGGDGAVLIDKKEDIYSIEIFNSDGSYATFCGNATLSFGWYLYKNNLVKDSFKIKTGGGIIPLNVYKRGRKGDFIAMKVENHQFYCPELLREKIMINRRLTFEIDKKIYRIFGSAVFVGNLHFVIFKLFPDKIMAKIVEKINKSTLFPCGVNIEFVSLNKNNIKVVVFERGAGRTKACGSGLSAIGFVMEKLYNKQGNFTCFFDGGKGQFEIKKSTVLIKAKPQFIFKGTM